MRPNESPGDASLPECHRCGRPMPFQDERSRFWCQKDNVGMSIMEWFGWLEDEVLVWIMPESRVVRPYTTCVKRSLLRADGTTVLDGVVRKYERLKL